MFRHVFLNTFLHVALHPIREMFTHVETPPVVGEVLMAFTTEPVSF